MKKEQLIKDILYEILDENGGWLTMSEIEEIIKEKYSSLKNYKTSILFIFRYNRDIFINNIKYDAYKLVKYGSQDDIKNNLSIRKIIFNFLFENETPKHIDEIVKYVLKYKPTTNKDSIRTSLRALLDIRYIYFGNDIYGILSKKYSEEYVPYQKINNVIVNSFGYIRVFPLISELLENNDTPVHINEISDNLLKLYPILKSRAISKSLKVNNKRIKKFKNRFYGLATKEYSENWVEINKDIKEKTILELASEYLTNEQLPKHLSEITDHLLKYRPELKKFSIMIALKKRNGTTFRNFENNFIGLFSKTYPVEYVAYNFRIRLYIKKVVTNYLQNEVNPKSISEICEYLKINLPYFNIRSIKQYLLTNSDNTFIRFENKYWGLVSKEYSNDFVKKKKDLKKESIHQLAYDYLCKEDTPVHKSEIYKYILQYKPYSNEHSICTTIQKFEHKMFRYFKNGYIGIMNKEYAKDYVEIIKQNRKKESIKPTA